MVRTKPRPRRRRREEQRQRDKQQKKINRAITNELLDTVLAGFSYQDNQLSNLPGEETAANETDSALFDDFGLNELHRRLFPHDTVSRMQLILDQLAGKAFPTCEANKNMVAQINQILAGTDLQCIFRDTGQKTRLRFINPPRSKHGYFQLRTSDARQLAIFTKSHFPAIQVITANR